MNKWILLAALLPLASAQAAIKVSGGGFELRQECIELTTANVKISSDECSSGKAHKGKNGNRSIHGDNNPGKGHKQGKQKK